MVAHIVSLSRPFIEPEEPPTEPTEDEPEDPPSEDEPGDPPSGGGGKINVELFPSMKLF